jgi:hypothetical protein
MVEEIPTGEEVLAGMYYLREHPIVILFDSRASHDFMSLACAQKTNLSLEKTEVPYLILTPGGQVVANCMVHKIPLGLTGQIFLTNLLILDGQGIGIIMRMRWMKMHKALLDISTCLVHLGSPTSGKVTLHLPVVPHWLELRCFTHPARMRGILQNPVLTALASQTTRLSYPTAARPPAHSRAHWPRTSVLFHAPESQHRSDRPGHPP